MYGKQGACTYPPYPHTVRTEARRACKGGIDRIERKQDAQDARYISMAERMSAVESSAKSAHHRIDRLEGREVREDG